MVSDPMTVNTTSRLEGMLKKTHQSSQITKIIITHEP
jgi:hypothetical protein